MASYSDCISPERNRENLFSFWYPKVMDAGIDTPKTIFFKLPTVTVEDRVAAAAADEANNKSAVPLSVRLQRSFYMDDPMSDVDCIQGWLDKEVIPVLEEERMTGKLFVKNGTFSNKFWANKSCIVEGLSGLADAVAMINYNALLVSAGGTEELVIREFIGYDGRKTACIYNGLPLRPEFRVFYDFDERKPIFVVNYWDTEYMMANLYDMTDKLVFSHEAKQLECQYDNHKDQVVSLVSDAMKNVTGLTGQWSVDIMWDERKKKYWLIDMAIAQTSAYWGRRPMKAPVKP